MIVACGMPSCSARTTPVCAEALVVGLQAGEDEIELLVAASPPASASATANASAAAERVVLDVDGAVGAARQRLADHLRDARRARPSRRRLRRRASP